MRPTEFLKIKREIQFDGLRGIAALIVLNSHFVCAFLPSLNSKFFPEIFNSDESNLFNSFFQTPPLSLIFNGHAAVCIFFVLSGYVLSIPFHQGRVNKLYSRLYARYLRLNIPIFFVTLFSFFLSKLNLYKNSLAGDLSGSQWMMYWYQSSKMSFSEMIKSSFFKGIFYGDDNFIAPLWTLKIEFIGSLLLIIYLIISFGKKQIYTLPIFLIFLTIFFKNEYIYYYLFIAGCFLKFFPVFKGFSFNLILFLGFYLISFQDSSFYKFFTYLPFNISPMIFCHGLGSLTLVYCIKNGFMFKILTSRFCLFFGHISYSIYLTHHLFLCSFISLFYLSTTQYPFSIYLLYFFYLIITTIFSYFIVNKIDILGIRFSNLFANKVSNSLKF